MTKTIIDKCKSLMIIAFAALLVTFVFSLFRGTAEAVPPWIETSTAPAKRPASI